MNQPLAELIEWALFGEPTPTSVRTKALTMLAGWDGILTESASISVILLSQDVEWDSVPVSFCKLRRSPTPPPSLYLNLPLESSQYRTR